MSLLSKRVGYFTSTTPKTPAPPQTTRAELQDFLYAIQDRLERLHPAYQQQRQLRDSALSEPLLRDLYPYEPDPIAHAVLSKAAHHAERGRRRKVSRSLNLSSFFIMRFLDPGTRDVPESISEQQYANRLAATLQLVAENRQHPRFMPTWDMQSISIMHLIYLPTYFDNILTLQERSTLWLQSAELPGYLKEVDRFCARVAKL